jgi:glycosyltransferase involved in cell wall biosynthesis
MTSLAPEPVITLGQRPQRPRTQVRDGVSVLVPCFNERGALGATIDSLLSSMRPTGRAFEVIVIDDGSTDGGTEDLERGNTPSVVRVLRQGCNRGYGHALKSGVAAARHELIAITDADGTYPNERLPELLERAREADMVVGARVGPGVHVPLLRRPAKWALTRLANYLCDTRIPDLNSGMRVMRRPVVRRFLRLLPDGFSFTTTITLAMLTHGYRVTYVPIDYHPRIGRSSIRPVRDTLRFLSLIVRTVMYFRPLKVFAPAAGVLLMSAVAWALFTKLVLGRLADVSALVLAMSAVQLLAVGLLADLIDKRCPGGAE